VQPLPVRTAEQLASRMPESARVDLLEWSANETAEHLMALVLERPVAAEKTAGPDSGIVIKDDRPYNEYYLLRRLFETWSGSYIVVLSGGACSI
jgi:spermidine synthase